MWNWLPLLNFIVQLLLLCGLVWYTLETYKIRKATQRSADAAIETAKVAQENLRLLKESYEERIGQGPQIVREAILHAKNLIVYWTREATHIQPPPQGNPDPTPLADSGLRDILPHARLISAECGTLLIGASAALTNAKSELETAYAAARKQTFPPNSGAAQAYLDQADGLLNSALAMLDK
jgi:hypothetical protein